MLAFAFLLYLTKLVDSGSSHRYANDSSSHTSKI